MSAETILTPSLNPLLEGQIAALGVETVELALQNAHLFQGLRALSRLSLRTATTCVQEGFPATLVVQLDPRAKSRGERVEMRLLTGNEIKIHGA